MISPIEQRETLSAARVTVLQMAQCRRHPLCSRSKSVALVLAIATCVLPGCAPSEPSGDGEGYPTIVAQQITVEDEPGGSCLVLHGARVIFSGDRNKTHDLSVHRYKSVLIMHSEKRATFLAALADADLSTQGVIPAGQKPHPFELDSGEYEIVNVGADGALSPGETSSVTSLRILKPVGR
jgi:hypothetical protein